MDDPFSLAGRCALVTGASRGIGAAIACGLAAAGADVAICARSEGDLERVAATIRGHGRRALVIACDVLDSTQVAACVGRAWVELGALDVLVNNAGGPLFQAPFVTVREDGWNRQIDLNLNSVYRFTSRVGARMIARGRGSVINIAAVLPTRAWPALAGYSAAKAAVLNLTQTLAVGWGPAGVRVNAICPGWVDTDINRSYRKNEATVATVIDMVPLGRWAEAQDLVGAVTWLSSDAARYVTGAIIPVDGGLAVGLSRRWQRDMQLPPG